MKYLVVILVFTKTVGYAGFEQRGHGARDAGLSAAYMPVADDIWAIWGNPGGLTRIHRYEFGVAYAPQPFGIPELRRCAAALAIPLQVGTIGVAAESFGFALYHECSGGVAFAGEVAGIGIGVTISYRSVGIQSYGSASAVTFDAGIEFPLVPSVTAGLDLSNLSGSTIGESEEKIPQSFAMGVAWSPARNMRLFVTYDKEMGFNASLHCGFEYDLVGEVTVRAGVADEPSLASAGLGIRLLGERLEYGLSHHDDLGWSHEVTIVLSWGGKDE